MSVWTLEATMRWSAFPFDYWDFARGVSILTPLSTSPFRARTLMNNAFFSLHCAMFNKTTVFQRVLLKYCTDLRTWKRNRFNNYGRQKPAQYRICLLTGMGWFLKHFLRQMALNESIRLSWEHLHATCIVYFQDNHQSMSYGDFLGLKREHDRKNMESRKWDCYGLSRNHSISSNLYYQ